MQMLESLISLFFFVLIIGMLIIPADSSNYLDTSYYRTQLAGDIWRVLDLKGAFNFEDAPFGCSYTKSCKYSSELSQETGYVIFISGTRFLSPYYSLGKHGQMIYTTSRVVVLGPNIPQKITFSLSK